MRIDVTEGILLMWTNMRNGTCRKCPMLFFLWRKKMSDVFSISYRKLLMWYRKTLWTSKGIACAKSVHTCLLCPDTWDENCRFERPLSRATSKYLDITEMRYMQKMITNLSLLHAQKSNNFCSENFLSCAASRHIKGRGTGYAENDPLRVPCHEAGHETSYFKQKDYFNVLLDTLTKSDNQGIKHTESVYSSDAVFRSQTIISNVLITITRGLFGQEVA